MGMLGKGKSKEAVDAMHESDRNVGGLMPWMETTPNAEIDKDKLYFCVATWGTMNALSMVKFAALTSKIGGELSSPASGLVGQSRQIQMGVLDVRAETFTVWHEREKMAAFYRSDAHQHAMKSMKGAIDFRVLRVWVRGADIPRSGDSQASKNFVLRIKSGGFPAAKASG